VDFYQNSWVDTSQSSTGRDGAHNIFFATYPLFTFPFSFPPLMSTARTSSKFVIIGCGGVVGEHTIRQLADRVGGNRILVLSHDPSGCCSQFRDLGADVQKGDLARPEEWKELLRGCAGFFIITPGEEVGLQTIDSRGFVRAPPCSLTMRVHRTELSLC
jgi:hypothetical protein